MGGVYLMISHGPPDNRVNHIKRYIDVDIDVVPIRKSPRKSKGFFQLQTTSFYIDLFHTISYTRILIIIALIYFFLLLIFIPLDMSTIFYIYVCYMEYIDL